MDDEMRFADGVGEDDFDDEFRANDDMVSTFYAFMDESDEKMSTERFLAFLNALAKGVFDEAVVPMPFVDVNNALDGAFDPETVSEGDEFQLEEDARFRMDTITDSDGKLWLPLFFNVEALHKGQTANVIMPVPLLDVLQIGLGDDELMGVVVDPFDRPCTLKKELLERFLGDCEEWQEKNEK